MIEFCIHEMDPTTCAYCTPRTRARTDTVEVSPSRMGHLPDCPHKDDDDYSRWGYVTRPGAWQDLCNGNPVVTDTGPQVGVEATVACRDCIARS